MSETALWSLACMSVRFQCHLSDIKQVCEPHLGECGIILRAASGIRLLRLAHSLLGQIPSAPCT